MSEDETAAAATHPDPELEAVFDLFLTGVEDGDPDREGLEPPADPTAIAEAEQALGLTLPPSFRAFLRRWNGAGAYDSSIYGVGGEEGFDIVALNLRGWREGLPEHLLGFAATLTGEVYCFDTSAPASSGEYPVVVIDPDEGELAAVCASFREWLERLPNLEESLSEQRGPQPMSVQEWESFLTREREKLRRLSKTPARQLTMPDPEKVRSDLGGKIPVDPRHLKPKE